MIVAFKTKILVVVNQLSWIGFI